MRDEIGADRGRKRRWLKSAIWMALLWIVVVLLAVFPFPWAWL
jgi:hypothetical protein